jgi:hypothetical protein
MLYKSSQCTYSIVLPGFIRFASLGMWMNLEVCHNKSESTLTSVVHLISLYVVCTSTVGLGTVND